MNRKQAISLLLGGPSGVSEWNSRRQTVDGILLLPTAFFAGIDLHQADLRGVDFSLCDLGSVTLSGANLTGANLHAARFVSSMLDQAILDGADATAADFRAASLENARLRRTDFTSALLHGCNIANADFSRAIFYATHFDIFTSIDNLLLAKGLDQIEHRGLSFIGLQTLRCGKGQLPETFLKGCGLRDWEVAAARLFDGNLTRSQVAEVQDHLYKLRANPAIDYSSCFISYSSKDEEFAQNLYAALQDSGVRCWFALEDMKVGDRIRTQIDEAIHAHDKLLPVLSENSVTSDWVEKEVETAFEKERQRKKTVLFPIRLDDAIMDAEYGWAADIRRSRYIGNFTGWKNKDEFQKSVERLLRDLKAGQGPESSVA